MKGKIVLSIVIVAIAAAAPLVLAQTKGPGFSNEPTTPDNWYSKSIALVIGIDSYSAGWPSLSSASKDADLVGEALKQQGFEVHVLKNRQATQQAIMKYLNDVIPPQLSTNDRFLLYFSGHGQTRSVPSKMIGYLIPADGRKIGGPDQFSSYISMKQLRDVMVDVYAAKHVMVIADSCFSGLLTTKSSGVGATVSQAMQYKGRMILNRRRSK